MNWFVVFKVQKSYLKIKVYNATESELETTIKEHAKMGRKFICKGNLKSRVA